jgi:hypothetical protein
VPVSSKLLAYPVVPEVPQRRIWKPFRFAQQLAVERRHCSLLLGRVDVFPELLSIAQSFVVE